MCALGWAVVALLAGTDYGAIGVASSWRCTSPGTPGKQQCILGVVLLLLELTAPLAFVLVSVSTTVSGPAARSGPNGCSTGWIPCT